VAFVAAVHESLGDDGMDAIADDVTAGRIDPYSAADRLLDAVRRAAP
jgi:hypothetical protein